MQAAEDSADRIRYLVNAAGTFVPKPFLEHQTADYDKYMTLNRSLYSLRRRLQRTCRRMAVDRS